jgi:hypothetical protein
VLVLVENLVEEEEKLLLVSVYFPANVSELLEGEAEMANCSVGGTHQGFVLGEELLRAERNSVPVSLEISEP